MTQPLRPDVPTLHQLLRLEGGELYWLQREAKNAKMRAWNTRQAGKRADNTRHGKYRRVVIFDRHYYAHHIIWAMIHGKWPTGEIDHRDGDPSNNDPSNLRPATRAQQMQNKRVWTRSLSGIKGVYQHPESKKWIARVSTKQRALYCMSFDTSDEAAQAYAHEAAKLYGEFACANR